MLFSYTHIFIYVIYNINIDIWIEGYLELLGCGLPPILKASRSCNLKASLAGPWTDCWRCWVTRYPIKTEQKTRERPVDSEDEHGIWLKLEGTLVDDDDDDYDDDDDDDDDDDWWWWWWWWSWSWWWWKNMKRANMLKTCPILCAYQM